MKPFINMPLVYVAGSFRGKTPWVVEQNIRKAEHKALEIAYFNAIPVCPHTMYRFFDKQRDDQFWLNATIGILNKCHGAYFLERWEESEGARLEMEFAGNWEKPVFSDMRDLREWINNWYENKARKVSNKGQTEQ